MDTDVITAALLSVLARMAARTRNVAASQCEMDAAYYMNSQHLNLVAQSDVVPPG